MKNDYEVAQMDIVCFQSEDIIRTSGDNTSGDDIDE